MKSKAALIITLITLLTLAFLSSDSVQGAPLEKRIVGKIVSVHGRNVNIDKGSIHGVKPKMIFNVYMPARVVRVPLSNEQLLVREKQIGQLVIATVEKNTARGEFLNARNLKLVKVGMSVSNVGTSLKSDVNAPPVVKDAACSPATEVPCGSSITINLDVYDVDDECHVFFWSASGGLLSCKETTTPSVTWSAPAAAGEYRINVEVMDGRGGKTEREIVVSSTGKTTEKYPLEVKDLLGAYSGRFSKINDMAFDRKGNAYLLDGANRKLVILDETFSVKAVSAEFPPSVNLTSAAVHRDCLFTLDSYAQKLHVAMLGDTTLPSLFKDVSAETGFGGRGTTNGYFLDATRMVTLKTGEVLVLDSENPSIHVYDADGSFLCSTGKKGKGKARMTAPAAMALDEEENLYVLDKGAMKVLVYKNLQFDYEFEVGAVNANDFVDMAYNCRTKHLLLLDLVKKEVRCFSRDGKAVGTLCGKSGADEERLDEPRRIFTDYRGLVYVTEKRGAALLRYDHQGNFLGSMGREDLSGVERVAAGKDGSLYLLDTGSYCVHLLCRDGWYLGKIGKYGTSKGRLQYPVSIDVDDKGRIFILDQDDRYVKVYDREGKFLYKVGKEPGTALTDPLDISVAGNYLVVLEDKEKHTVRAFDLEGNKVEVFPRSGEVPYPFRVAVSKDGKVFLFDRSPHLREFTVSGSEGKPMKKKLQHVTGMTVDSRGFLIAADRDRGLVTEIVPGVAGSRSVKNQKFFPDPLDVAADGYGNVYVLDGTTKRIVKLGRRN